MRDWLYTERRKKFLSGQKLADAMGISLGMYSLIENGKRLDCIDPVRLERIAKALDLPLGDVVRMELDYWKEGHICETR